MEKIKQQRLNVGIMFLAILVTGLLFLSYNSATAVEKYQAQGIVDKARLTLKGFMQDSTYSWLQENLDRAKGVLIFPQVIKGGFIWGGSGGNRCTFSEG